MVSGPPWLTVLRDLLLLGVGIFGILYQLVTGKTDPALLVVFTTMLGIPGVANVLWLLKQSGEPPQPEPPSDSSSDQPSDQFGSW
jgi:hypothetical protein